MNNDNTKLLTIEDVQKRFPDRKGSITQEVVDVINKTLHEPEFQGESLLQTAVTYEAVLHKNKAKISDYLNAVRFVAYLLTMDDNYTEAYKRVFTDRDFVANRLDAEAGSVKYRELTSAASRYRKSKLVVDILTVSQAPLELMFTGARYKALGVLAEIMTESKYDRDRINAAKELLAATKGPDNVKIDLDIGVKESSAVQNLNAQLAALASNSMAHLKAGTTDLKQLGAMKVNDEEVIDVDTSN